MWALYHNYQDRYRRNLNDPNRQWTHKNECEEDQEAWRTPSAYPRRDCPHDRSAYHVTESSPVRSSITAYSSRSGDHRQSFQSDVSFSRGARSEPGYGYQRHSEKAKRHERRNNEYSDAETSGTETPLSSRGSACESTASSGRPHSETYEAVRDLNTELWKLAEKTATDWNQVRDDKARELDRLYSESFDCIFRNTLENHPELPEDLENEIQSHAYANNIRFPHPRTNNLGLFELYRNNPPLSFDGMDPFLHPDEQLSRLKEKEKYLLIKRWEEIWDQVRPPVPKWHELRTKSFHAEAAKARKMSTSSDLQRISHQARLAILDLWRSQVTDKILFMSSMIPDEAKEDVFGDDLQRLRREALVVAMKNTFHARRPEIGKNARPEFAFSPWGGAAASKILGV